MKVLITNDDGINAEGLAVLANRLSRENEVYVVAPHTNRSGVSHCITMNKPLLIERHGENRYSLEGFPVDCVISALRGGFLPGVPDVVLSGINDDANIGTDVLYSGTCAGARQASLYGVPGIALSLCHRAGQRDAHCSYDALADFAADNIGLLAKLCGSPNGKSGSLGYFVNVNALSQDTYRGVKLAGLSNREYRDSVRIESDASGRQYSVFCGGLITSHGDGTDDASLVDDGYISVSVIHSEGVCDKDDRFGIEKQFVLKR